MPTSSQALILLSSDGRLPPKVPRQTFSVNSVPYPTRNIDFNATCVEYVDTPDEYSGDVIASRQKRIRVGDILDSLPELLTIKSYHGSLAYDVNSKVLRWKVDTEVPRSRMEAFLTYRTDSDLKPDYYREPRVRFPSIYEEEAQDNGRYFNIENTYRYTHRHRSQPVGNDVFNRPDSPTYRSENDSAKNFVSFPQLFKTTMDADTYKRLYDLGFRQQNRQNSVKTQDKRLKESRERKRVKLQAWESVEDFKDKEFRLEDLNLKTGQIKTGSSSHDLRTNFSQNTQIPSGVSLSQYMSERNNFFAKYGNYKSDVRVSEEPLDEADSVRTHVPLPDIVPEQYQNITMAGKEAEGIQIGRNSDVKHAPSQNLSLMDNVTSMTDYNKWKKQKLTTVRLRKKLPAPQPLSLCFSLLDNAKCHTDVKDLIENQVGSTVTCLRFDPVSVHALDSKAKSRWVVTLNDKESVDLLVSSGLIVDGGKIEVRSLDEALKEEVEAYRLYQMVQRGQVMMPSYNDCQRRRRRDRNGTRST